MQKYAAHVVKQQGAVGDEYECLLCGSTGALHKIHEIPCEPGKKDKLRELVPSLYIKFMHAYTSQRQKIY